MKKVIILHQYDTKSHFEAIYKAGRVNDIIVEDYIILSKIALLRKAKNMLINTRNLYRPIKFFIEGLFKLLKLKYLKNKTLIVGIAPYDYLMNKYEDVFKKNKCIYFTSWEYWDGSSFPRGKLKNKENFEKILKNNFLGVACISAKTEEGIKRINSNTTVVNHSIITKEYKIYKNNISNAKKFIFLGQFIQRKGIDFIIRWVKESKKNFEFYFAGYGDMEEQINELQNEDERVTNLGQLKKIQIKQSLGKYDYLVLPSKKEPFGIAIVEALACGLPVIASNVVGPSEIIENYKDGYLFDYDNYYDFKKVMDIACDLDSYSYSMLKENAMKKSLKYDCYSIINKWKELI